SRLALRSRQAEHTASSGSCVDAAERARERSSRYALSSALAMCVIWISSVPA
ncbi:MAG: hypothetical protein V7636_2686, partial [Actinomycetota bacterium]